MYGEDDEEINRSRRALSHDIWRDTNQLRAPSKWSQAINHAKAKSAEASTILDGLGGKLKR
jgi:hypothetical protein